MIRHANLIALSREHHQALVLAKKAAQSAQATAETQQAMCRRIASAFASDLEGHFSSEERDLPAYLDDPAGRPLLDRLHADHAALRQLGGALAQGQSEYLAEFASQLAAHVRFEERELFPAIERVLNATL